MVNNKNYKQTEIGRIPKEWEVVKLEEIISSLYNGIWGETPIKQEKSYPVIRSTEITHDGKIDLSNVAFRRIPDEKVDRYSLKEGDILLVASSGSSRLIGRAAIFKQSREGEVYLFSNFMLRLRPKNVDSIFLYYYLNSSQYYRFLKSLQQTSTGLRNLPKREVVKFKLPLPPLSEQKKIAEILSTVDETIEKVDESIKRTERLKKGLMQNLLTKGIGHKEFKDTEIGRIAKEWEVVRLGDKEVAEIRKGKSINEINRFDNVAFIPMEFVPNTGIFVNFEIRSIKDVKSFTYCEKGDLLLAKITPSLENGKQGIVPDTVPNGFALTTTEVFPIVCSGIERLFLFYVLKHPKFRNKIIASMTGTTGRQRATKISVQNLLLPFPPLPEQKKIAEILSTVDKRLELLKSKKEKLKKIKKGLMNDLLTGKRRVKV